MAVVSGGDRVGLPSAGRPEETGQLSTLGPRGASYSTPGFGWKRYKLYLLSAGKVNLVTRWLKTSNDRRRSHPVG